MAANETVTVACKLPHGVELRLFHMRTSYEPMMGGGFREVQIAQQHGKSVVINGTARYIEQAPKIGMVDSFCLTPGVPKEFWEEWLKQNKDSDIVVNGLIFANNNEASARAQVRDHDQELSGFEPIDPANAGKRVRGIVAATK